MNILRLYSPPSVFWKMNYTHNNPAKEVTVERSEQLSLQQCERLFSCEKVRVIRFNFLVAGVLTVSLVETGASVQYLSRTNSRNKAFMIG
jgi:hypothetical protein